MHLKNATKSVNRNTHLNKIDNLYCKKRSNIWNQLSRKKMQSSKLASHHLNNSLSNKSNIIGDEKRQQNYNHHRTFSLPPIHSELELLEPLANNYASNYYTNNENVAPSSLNDLI